MSNAKRIAEIKELLFLYEMQHAYMDQHKRELLNELDKLEVQDAEKHEREDREREDSHGTDDSDSNDI